MLVLNFVINNPWSDRFEPLRSWSGKLFKHKAWEIEVYRCETIVELETRFSVRTDHAGLTVGLGLFSYALRAQFYDTRHWNYAEHRYEIYNEKGDSE
jgi:hypothetical protein